MKHVSRLYTSSVARGDWKRDWKSDWKAERSAGGVGAKHDPFVVDEGAELLYGLQPVLAALRSKRRDKIHSLYVQERSGSEKTTAASRARKEQMEEARQLAEREGIAVQWHTKHHLNAITANALHQGLVLAASPLDFVPLEELPSAADPQCWLALDQVVDPRNFGALLRTGHYFGLGGVVTSARNGAPLTPVVSKASAGAMESMTVHSVKNMMQFIERCKANGWRVIGAGMDPEASITSQDIVLDSPTILLLGNEGYGLRKNIERLCDELVHIPAAGASQDPGLDSLNVSVAGGVLMHQLSRPAR